MKIPLKKKYTEAKSSSGGKTPSSNSSVKPITLEKYLMKNERAITMHYENCAVRGLWEQIPTGLRAKYKKMLEKGRN